MNDLDPPHAVPTQREPLRSEHFVLRHSSNAYGETVHLNHHKYPEVQLLGPFNAWAEKHYSVERNESNLLHWLEIAYKKGREDMKQEFRDLLGLGEHR